MIEDDDRFGGFSLIFITNEASKPADYLIVLYLRFIDNNKMKYYFCST